MKSVNTLITVGMPVYNGEKYLKEAIQSILSQTYTNFDLIIADDNSTDNSAQIYKSFAKKDKRIHLFRHKKNIGSIANFNFVLHKARGKYFLWAAQDDIRDKNALKELINLYNNYPDAVLAASSYKNLFGNKKYFVYPQDKINNNQNKIESIKYFLKTDNLSFFYGLHKTNNLKKTGGYWIDSRPFFKSSDFLTIYKILLAGKFIYTPKILFLKRDTGYYTNQFKVIQKMNFNTIILKKILRFIISPVYYIYDFTYATYYLFRSQISLSDKIDVELALAINISKKHIKFIVTIIQGCLAFVKGISKILKPYD